jgi:hypothetical protein
MTHSKNETMSIGWCDNGLVDGRFVDGLISTIMTANLHNIKITNKVRVSGNQIGRQRQILFDNWADKIKTDWLLWVDSDIVLTLDVLKMLWDAADQLTKPVVVGLYFVSNENEQSLMQPLPSIFNETKDEHRISYINPIPENKIIKIDCAGFGIVLMHKTVINKMRKNNLGYSLFAEKEYLDEKYVSEDIVFFRKLKEIGIQLYAHTGAVVQHMKRFSFDKNYYDVYWNAKEQKIFTKELN